MSAYSQKRTFETAAQFAQRRDGRALTVDSYPYGDLQFWRNIYGPQTISWNTQMDLQEQLEAVNATFNDALERGDAKAAAAQFTDGGICIAPDLPTARGQAALVKLFQSWIDMGTGKSRDHDHQAESMGDGAYMVCAYESEMRQDDGSVYVERGKALQVFRRDESGAWKIHRMGISTDSA